jgi:hydrogenase maturation protease
MTAPLLVFGWGNASRGDDALGPLFVDRLRATWAGRAGVDFIDDYQLMVEHALDLAGRERVLFVDASRVCAPPFEATLLQAAVESSLGSHALSPQALMQVYRDVQHADAPPCTLLAIRGERFELGAAPTEAALAHLAAALHWAQGWLALPQEAAACTS